MFVEVHWDPEIAQLMGSHRNQAHTLVREELFDPSIHRKVVKSVKEIAVVDKELFVKAGKLISKLYSIVLDGVDSPFSYDEEEIMTVLNELELASKALISPSDNREAV